MLEDKSIIIEMTESAKQWVLEKGYIPSMGARPMQRVFDQHIKKPISKELLFGKLMNGGKVKVDAVNNDLDIKYEHKA